MESPFTQKYIEENAFLYWIGIISFCCIVIRLTLWIYQFVYVHFTGPALEYRSFGKWALVTGSTDGIGKGIATELARCGLNIILVSKDKLEEASLELENKFHVKTKCIQFDFTTDEGMTSSFYDVIKNEVADLEVGILVNNVGIVSDSVARYLDCFESLDRSTGLINCNVRSVLRLTQLILPQMLKRGKGLVVNMSSSAADVICPTFSLYSGSKKFDDTFTKALGFEYEKQGIIFQSVTPGFVRTSMTEKMCDFEEGLFFPPYQEYARHLMKAIGKTRVTTGYWLHQILIILISWLPERIWAWSRMEEFRRKNI